MLINEYKQQNIYFQAIRLKPKDYEKSKQIMSRLANPAQKTDNDITELYRIFYPYIQKEAEYKSKPNTFNDVFSEMNLLFLELVNDIKNNPLLKDIISKLNKYYPSKDVRNIGDHNNSLDLHMFSNNLRLRRIDRVTSDQLPMPESAVEIENHRKQLISILNKSNLPEAIKIRIEKYLQLGSYKAVANEEGTSTDTISRNIRSGIIKIQYENNSIPPKSLKHLENLVNTLEIDVDTAINLLIRNSDPAVIKNNLQDIAEVLECSYKEIKQKALTFPAISILSKEYILKYIDECAQSMNCQTSDIKKIIRKRFSIVMRKPETLKENIKRISEYTETPEKEIIKQILEFPRIISFNSETIIHINKIRNYFRQLTGQIPVKRFDNISYKKAYSDILCTLMRESNPGIITDSYRNFNLDEFLKTHANETFTIKLPDNEIIPDFIKYMQEQSEIIAKRNIFDFNVVENFQDTYIDFTKIPKEKEKQAEQIVKTLLRLPEFKNKEIDIFKINILKIMHLFNYSPEKIIELAKKQPTLLKLKPESLYKNLQLHNYYRKIQYRDPSNELIITNEHKTCSRIIHTLLKRQDKRSVPHLFQEFNLMEFIKTNSDKHFTFNIPQDKNAQDFVQYMTRISKDITGKNIFEFNIVEDWQPPHKPTIDIPEISIKQEELEQIESIIGKISNLPYFANKNLDNFKIKIFRIMHLFNLSSEEIIKLAQNKPVIFSLKPENLYENYKAYNYYQKIQHKKPSDEIITTSKTVIYRKMIFALLKRQHSEVVPINIINFNFEEFLKTNSNNHFTLKIPQDETAQDFIQYATRISKEVTGKNIFEFNIIEDWQNPHKPSIGIPQKELEQIDIIIENLSKLPDFKNKNFNNLRIKIFKMMNLFNLSPEGIIDLAKKQPAIFKFKPENIHENLEIYNFYRKIQGKKPSDKIVITDRTTIYPKIIFALLKHQYSDTVPLRCKYFNAEEFLKANAGNHFSFKIPQSKATQDFIQYATQLSENTIGKNIFEFKITDNFISI